MKKCNSFRIVNGELVKCGGDVYKVETKDNGLVIADEVCSKCGKRQNLQPFVLNPPKKTTTCTNPKRYF